MDTQELDTKLYKQTKINELELQRLFFCNKEKKNAIYRHLLSSSDFFSIQNRRFLGNKYKLLSLIEYIIKEKCGVFDSFCDIFAGTGVVGSYFNNKNVKIISNDILNSNFVAISAFLSSKNIDIDNLIDKINSLNQIKATEDNYFSVNYGGTYFTIENARKIGAIRERIEKISENLEEKNVLLASLIYACDKAANTVGHYDAFRKVLDNVKSIKLLIPEINFENNINNEIYKEDANSLIKKIECDILYIDPPYNSRQYCDAYHLLENLVNWEKPPVFGKAKKMDRAGLKSRYCLKTAAEEFDNLIANAKCKHILISYNNTGESKNGRSNARITDKEILKTLKKKGATEVYEYKYRAFTTGKSEIDGNSERIFYCKVND